MSYLEYDDSADESMDLDDGMFDDDDGIFDMDDTSHLTSLFNLILSNITAVVSQVQNSSSHTIRSAFGVI